MSNGLGLNQDEHTVKRTLLEGLSTQENEINDKKTFELVNIKGIRIGEPVEAVSKDVAKILFSIGQHKGSRVRELETEN